MTQSERILLTRIKGLEADVNGLTKENKRLREELAKATELAIAHAELGDNGDDGIVDKYDNKEAGY